VSRRLDLDLVVESEEYLGSVFEGLGVGWVSRGTSWDTEWHDGGVDPGLGEAEEFSDLSKCIGVELKVVLERSTHTLSGQGGPNNVLEHTAGSLDPSLEGLIVSFCFRHMLERRLTPW